MTTSELQRDHPELYKEIFELGVAHGQKAKEAFNEFDPELAKSDRPLLKTEAESLLAAMRDKVKPQVSLASFETELDSELDKYIKDHNYPGEKKSTIVFAGSKLC